MARVLVGVTGGIAAYKACELVRLLDKGGHEVVPLVTPGAERFVRAETFFALARRSPAEDLYVHLTRADLLVVAPLTANTLAKLANGYADNLVAEAALAHRGPLLLAPAMNPRMWDHAATQRNLNLLRERGVRVIEPEEGPLASRGEHGVGRLPAPESLLGEVEELLPAAPGPWDGLRVLVTAGGTREPIDAVRYVGNRSSGRMGFALADRAARRGAEVTLIAASVALPTPNRVRRVDVSTAAELSEAVRREFADIHLLLMAAAVADFRPARAESGKIAREESGSLELRLEPTDDVLAAVGADRRDDQIVVAFAAEHGGDAIARAREKLRRKGADAIVVNDVSRDEIGFDSDLNQVVVVDAEREYPVALGPKEEVADAILDRVQNQYGDLPVTSQSGA